MSKPSPSQPELWKRKLAAYLHDPPSKCLDIATHGEHWVAAFHQADHRGTAEDRLAFFSKN